MIDPDEARDAAQDILDGADYSPAPESPVERAVSWVFDRLGDLVATLVGGGAGSVIGWVILGLIVGFATWLFVRAVRVGGVGLIRPGDGLRYGTESLQDPQSWLDEAERLAPAGDHSAALRCRYQAMLAEMIVAGVVEHVPGRTSGEYRSVLAERLPVVAATMAAVTGRFEATWFGGASVDEPTYRSFAADCVVVVDAASEHGVRA